MVAAYLSGTANDRATAAMRSNAGLAQSAPAAFDAGTFIAALAARGITATLGAGGTGVSYPSKGLGLGTQDVEKVNKYRREITLYLIEAANAA